MHEAKRWKLLFRTKGGCKQRTVRCVCAEEELQGEKEKWAMIIEE